MVSLDGYALWIVPAGNIYDKLTKIISALSEKYKTPTFEPHVTLLGPVNGTEGVIIEKTEQLASSIQPFEIKLTIVGYSEEYFRCLFVNAEPTRPVMNTHEKAAKIFGLSKTKYAPHASLMYGTTPFEIKKQIISEIGKSLGLTFQVGSLHLFSIKGEPEDWFRVKEFILKH